MINIILRECNDSFYVKASGHSGVKNQSIVCASVSVLLETWRLTEEILEKQHITYDEGIEAYIPKSEISKTLFTQLCIGLSAIQKQYPKDIALIIGG